MTEIDYDDVQKKFIKQAREMAKARGFTTIGGWFSVKSDSALTDASGKIVGEEATVEFIRSDKDGCRVLYAARGLRVFFS